MKAEESQCQQCQELKRLLLESWQMWVDMAEDGDLKVGPNYWIRYAEMKLKVESITSDVKPLN